MSDDRTPEARARDRRESLTWMILAGLATLVPMGFSVMSGTHLPPGTWSVSIEVVVFSAVLIAAIPFVVRINHQFDLPGGALITAIVNREPRPYGWAEVLLAGVLWSVIALVLLVIILVVGVALLFVFFRSFLPTIPARRIQQAPTAKQSAIWLVFGVVITAVSAGVQEEILFRLVLMGVVSWALITITGNEDQGLGRGQLWLANLVQGYFFGFAHFVSDLHMPKGIFGMGQIVVRPFLQPQTLTGVFLGWLYLRDGLETSIVSHIFFDLLPVLAVRAAVR